MKKIRNKNEFRDRSKMGKIIGNRWFVAVVLSVFFVYSAPSHAMTLAGALEKAASDIHNSSAISSEKHIVITVVNYHSQKQDQLAKQIETDLYFALERVFPESRLVLLSESVVGVSSKDTVFIKGTYQQEGKITILRLQVLKGTLTGEIIAQAEVNFDTESTIKKSLIAVLDIEAETLNDDQRRIFSDIFRSALLKYGNFDMVSSADIYKMDPDEIQRATECTRDECATVIGRQLGVDRVISSSLVKVDENFYFLSAKVMDIDDSTILVSKTVEHTGNLRTLKSALENLAYQLTKTQRITDTAQTVPMVQKTPSRTKTVEAPQPFEKPPIKIEKKSGIPWWGWVVGAVVVGAIGSSLSNDEVKTSDNGNGGSSDDSCSAGAGNCGSTRITW